MTVIPFKLCFCDVEINEIKLSIFHYVPDRFSTELLKEKLQEFVECSGNIDGSMNTGNISSTVQFTSSCPSVDK